MFITITLFVGIFAAGFVLANFGSARSRNEERAYLRSAKEERPVGYSGAPNAPISSTDDHYLHPNRARTRSFSGDRELSPLPRTP